MQSFTANKHTGSADARNKLSKNKKGCSREMCLSYECVILAREKTKGRVISLFFSM